MTMKTYIRILIATLLLAGSCSLQASGLEKERADLARLVHELDFLIQETRAIAAGVTPDPRISFDYSALADDLTQIRRQISAHLQGVLMLPNEVPPIEGRYSIRGPGGYCWKMRFVTAPGWTLPPGMSSLPASPSLPSRAGGAG